MSKQLKSLVELLKEFDTGMLATRTPYGHISSRPMTLQEPREDRALWIVGSKDSSSVENIKNSSHVNLSMRSSSDQSWVSIAASATLVFNRETIKSLWDDSWDVWFSDPEQAVLIELEPFQIDFWEPKMGKLGRLFELAKAHLSDSTPDLAPIKTLHISDTLLAPAMKGDDS
jgi:general stress protein 26